MIPFKKKHNKVSIYKKNGNAAMNEIVSEISKNACFYKEDNLKFARNFGAVNDVAW